MERTPWQYKRKATSSQTKAAYSLTPCYSSCSDLDTAVDLLWILSLLLCTKKKKKRRLFIFQGDWVYRKNVCVYVRGSSHVTGLQQFCVNTLFWNNNNLFWHVLLSQTYSHICWQTGYHVYHFFYLSKKPLKNSKHSRVIYLVVSICVQQDRGHVI